MISLYESLKGRFFRVKVGFRVRKPTAHRLASLTPSPRKPAAPCGAFDPIWVVVKMMVPFWVQIIIRHLLFRVLRKGP